MLSLPEDTWFITNSLTCVSYPVTGDTVDIVAQLYAKYRPVFDARLFRLFDLRHKKTLKVSVQQKILLEKNMLEELCRNMMK